MSGGLDTALLHRGQLWETLIMEWVEVGSVKVEVSPKDVKEKKADDRGRVTLGAKYAGQTVTVAVLEVDDGEN